MSGLFRCAGDILFDDNEPLPGQISNVQLKQFSETSNFLQYKKPLTRDQPYFFAQIRNLAIQSRITLGIAGPDIDNDAHPGHWNNTVGYHSDTGNCFTSHSYVANTKGEQFSVGDRFGVLITHFGKKMSTVLFLKNEIPVATRYLFEPDHCKFLPTLCLENGPIDLGIMWPQVAHGVPKFEETNMINWIKDTGVQYDIANDVFHQHDKTLQEVTIQSPVPLAQDMVHFEVVVKESEAFESPAVGIATCSPLKPPPTCNLLRDFFRWKANGVDLQSRVGQRIGFGIHYNPNNVNEPFFNDKDEQLVLCFVTLNMQIVFFRMMMQPEGGFFPLIVLTRNASKISIDVDTNRDLGNDATKDILDKLYKEKEAPALAILDDDKSNRAIDEEMFRKAEDVQVNVTDTLCDVQLSSTVKKIHVLQYKKALTPLESCFSVEIVQLNEDSSISIGVADLNFPLHKHLGKHTPSSGYVSRDGKMYFNEKSNGNVEGERFGVGDTVSLKILSFSEDDLSVVLFIKNDRPIGTRFLRLQSVHEFYPTISLCGNGYDVKIQVYWQNRLGEPQSFFPANLNDLCLPEGAEVDQKDQMIYVKDHNKPVCIQWPCPIDEDNLNHFEIEIVDDFGASTGVSPPVIALASACPQSDQATHSNYKLDFLRFWAVGEAEHAVSVNDLIGWGVLYPPSQTNDHSRMVICYMTINRNIALVRVMFEPPGGLYPCIVLPPDSVNRVKLETTALKINNHPLTVEIIDKLLTEAQDIYAAEQAFVRSGRDLDEFEIDKSKLLQTMPDLEMNSTYSTANGSDEVNRSSPPKLLGVVSQAKSANVIQKAVKTYRENIARTQDGKSKACVIL